MIRFSGSFWPRKSVSLRTTGRLLMIFSFLQIGNYNPKTKPRCSEISQSMVVRNFSFKNGRIQSQIELPIFPRQYLGCLSKLDSSSSSFKVSLISLKLGNISRQKTKVFESIHKQESYSRILEVTQIDTFHLFISKLNFMLPVVCAITLFFIN